jgi:TetR/AcrR family transcriptional repressor of mexJK operon
MKSKSPLSAARGATGRPAAYNRKTARPKPQRAGRPTLEELERRKVKVMQVATELFVQHGYAATSLVDIAKAAGVATRTLYQHFGDKEAIFMEVITARESGAVFPHPSFAADVSLFDAMMQVARYVCDVALRPRSVDLMRLVVAESRRFPEFMMNLCDKTFAHFRGEVAAMFDELAAQKIAPAVDSSQSALLFHDLILGTTPVLVYAGWSSSRPSEADLQARVELFILGRFGPSVAKRARTGKKAKAVVERQVESGPAAPRRRAKAKAA